MWQRLSYGGLILLTTPFVCVAVAVGLAEMFMGLDGNIALIIVRPFTWAVERGRREPAIPPKGRASGKD